jgi:hypothetical protein
MIRESTALDLQTRGRVPDELEGRLLRIGCGSQSRVLFTGACRQGRDRLFDRRAGASGRRNSTWPA